MEGSPIEGRQFENEVEVNPFKNIVLREEREPERPAETVKKVNEFELE